MAIERAAQAGSSRISAVIRRMIGTHDAYRRLFLTEAGELRPDAVIVLRDLAADAGLGRAQPDLNHPDMLVREGKNRLLLRILAQLRLDHARIAKLRQQMRTNA